MSKASEWAAAEHQRQEAIAEAMRKLERDEQDTPVKPPKFKHLASVSHREGQPILVIHGSSLGSTFQDAKDALELAAWIVTTFGDPEPPR